MRRSGASGRFPKRSSGCFRKTSRAATSSSSDAGRRTSRHGSPGVALASSVSTSRRLSSRRRGACSASTASTSPWCSRAPRPFRIPMRASTWRSPSTARVSGRTPSAGFPRRPRLLRPGGRLIFLVDSFLLSLCIPAEEGVVATERLLRPAFGPHRIEWPGDQGIAFHPSHGEWIRLLRRSGFEIEELIEVRPPEGATTSYPVGLARVGPEVAIRGDLEGAQTRRR